METMSAQKLLNTQEMTNTACQMTKRDEVFSFCGMWTPAEAKEFENRISDFERIDTNDFQRNMNFK
ncbi:hypothetical protein FACS189494_05350 [Spirochaetia bacterium]|nr:hypothetical protein FACS189494_05350 [Spirochaetia bacterium]